MTNIFALRGCGMVCKLLAYCHFCLAFLQVDKTAPSSPRKMLEVVSMSAQWANISHNNHFLAWKPEVFEWAVPFFDDIFCGYVIPQCAFSATFADLHLFILPAAITNADILPIANKLAVGAVIGFVSHQYSPSCMPFQKW